MEFFGHLKFVTFILNDRKFQMTLTFEQASLDYKLVVKLCEKIVFVHLNLTQ